MARVPSSQAEPIPNVAPPPIVYFWGPVRAHVNRVAIEYAKRLHAEPIWLDVHGSTDAALAAREAPALPASRTFVLRAGRDVQLTSTHPSAAPSTPGGGRGETALETEVETVLTFPKVVGSALRAAAKSGARSAFVLSNVDRLGHLYPMFEHGMAGALLRAFRSRGIVLILTSENLLPLPQLELECAFEVSSTPEEQWWEAEVRPGIPVSCCSECPGSASGAYAICEPDFRLACPVLSPFPEEPA